MSYSNDKYPLCKILKVYYSSLVNLKMLSIKEKNTFPVKKIQMKGIITSIPKTPQSFSAYSIDCFERLKAYYQLKKEKYYLGKDHIKTFYLKRKELKYDFKEWKSFMRNSIVSLFLASNLFYFIKNDIGRIRTYAPDGNCLAGSRLNHSATMSYTLNIIFPICLNRVRRSMR